MQKQDMKNYKQKKNRNMNKFHHLLKVMMMINMFLKEKKKLKSLLVLQC